MITDSIENIGLYFNLSPLLKTGLQWLVKEGSGAKKVDRHEIWDNSVFALVQEYQTKSKRVVSWEAHKKYVDIHFIVKGTEQVGYANIGKLKITKAYDDKDDYMLLKGVGNFLILEKNHFAIFYPQDAHMPGLAISGKKSRVKKIVIKVKYDKP